MSIIQICEDDWIQILVFFSRPQLFRLALLHPLFHQLIQQYFPEHPYAQANMAIWINQNDGQLWAGLCIYDWENPLLAFQYENWNEFYRFTKWLGIRPFDDYGNDNTLNENLNAMEKCYRIVEIFENRAHINCPDKEWVIHEDNGYKYSNIEVTKFIHDPHFEQDETYLFERKKCFKKRYGSSSASPKSMKAPFKFVAQMSLASNCNEIAHLFAHLELPFIHIRDFSILDDEPPFWAEKSSPPIVKGEISPFDNVDENKLEEQRKQLFNFLELIFTPESYQNTKISSIFAEISVRIQMDNFVKFLLNKWSNRPSLDLLNRMANHCHQFSLLKCKASHLQTNLSEWKALICNINGTIKMDLLAMDYRTNNMNILLNEELLPLLYAYNPQENPERILKVFRFCDYWENLLTNLIEDFLANHRRNITYHHKVEIYDSDNFNYRWIEIFYKINTYMMRWQEFFYRSPEMYQMDIIMFDGRQCFGDFLLMRNGEEKQYYLRLMIFPESDGCKMSIFQYRISETTFHENLCKKGKNAAQWWKKCIKLYIDLEGMEALDDPKLVKDEHCMVRTIEDKEEIEMRWTNYILIKWLANWRNYFDN